MSDLIFDSTIQGMNSVLNLRSANQGVISSNIANADTPGYHAKKLEFEDALRSAFEVDERMALGEDGVEEGHFTRMAPNSVVAEIYDNPNGVVNLDGNTVDRNSEQVSMAENQIHFDAAAEALKRKLALLKYAVSDGGGR